MSYMKRDHGSEHDRGGCLGDENQPNEPAPQRALSIPKVPPIPFTGPASAGPVTKLSSSPNDESQQLCDDLLLTAEDAAEILETLDTSSARQADRPARRAGPRLARKIAYGHASTRVSHS